MSNVQGNIIPITKELAFNVLAVVDKGLSHGLGKPVPGQMCVEAAVNYAQGQAHNDEPNCVNPRLRGLKIDLNDYFNIPEKMRAKALRRVAVAQLGSFGKLNWGRFQKDMKADLVKNYQPANIKKHAAEIKKVISQLSKKKLTVEQVDQTADMLSAISSNWTQPLKFKASTYLHEDALVRYVAKGLGLDADTSDMMERFKILSEAAEVVVRALKKQKIPGTKYLYLTEKKYSKKQQTKILNDLWKKHNPI